MSLCWLLDPQITFDYRLIIDSSTENIKTSLDSGDFCRLLITLSLQKYYFRKSQQTTTKL